MKHSGFTLVEVLVVSIILAILAITASVSYRGYILDSAQNTVEELGGVVASAANAYYRKTGSAPTTDQLNVFFNDPSRYNIVVSPPNIMITDQKYSISDTVQFQ